MLIRKKEITDLSDNIRRMIDGEKIDIRDNKEGVWNILKNDIHTLNFMRREEADVLSFEKDGLREILEDISHQLKTPLTASLIMIDLLPQNEFSNNIRDRLRHMDWLISNLLKQAKLDSKSIVFNFKEISFRDLMQEVLNSVAIILEIKEQKVILRGDVNFICDIKWTREALTNLVKNAGENSRENSEIIIESGENPLFKWISVTNDGNITNSQKVELFRRFEGSNKGYGIGLPLALSIMKNQNGDIEVKNEDDKVIVMIKFFK